MRTIRFEKVTAGFAELRMVFKYDDSTFKTNCTIVIGKVKGMDIRPLNINVSNRDINKPIDAAIEYRRESIVTYDDGIVISGHSRVRTCERGDGVNIISIDEFDGYEFIPVKRIYIQERPDGTFLIEVPNDTTHTEYVVSFDNGEIASIEC